MTNIDEFINLEDVDVNKIIATPASQEPKDPLWANVVSIILHPVFMTLYGVTLLFVFTDFGVLFGGQYFRFFIPVALLSCIIPVCGIILLRRMNLISDYDLKNKAERSLPFLITFLSYASLVYFFIQSGLHIFFLWFIALLIAPLLLMIIAAVITIFWKISVHMLGIGSLLGGILGVCYIKGIDPYFLFMVLFILAGLLGSARLTLKRHTAAQVYAGFLLGFTITFACILFAVLYGIEILKFIL